MDKQIKFVIKEIELFDIDKKFENHDIVFKIIVDQKVFIRHAKVINAQAKCASNPIISSTLATNKNLKIEMFDNFNKTYDNLGKLESIQMEKICSLELKLEAVDNNFFTMYKYRYLLLRQVGNEQWLSSQQWPNSQQDQIAIIKIILDTQSQSQSQSQSQYIQPRLPSKIYHFNDYAITKFNNNNLTYDPTISYYSNHYNYNMYDNGTCPEIKQDITNGPYLVNQYPDTNIINKIDLSYLDLIDQIDCLILNF